MEMTTPLKQARDDLEEAKRWTDKIFKEGRKAILEDGESISEEYDRVENTIRTLLDRAIEQEAVSGEDAKAALVAFADAIDAIRWLLNHAKESPNKRIVGLMESFTIKDNHTSRTDETLERLWNQAPTIRALLEQAKGDA